MTSEQATDVATRLRTLSSELLSAPVDGLSRLEADAKVRAQALVFEAFCLVSNLAMDISDREVLP